MGCGVSKTFKEPGTGHHALRHRSSQDGVPAAFKVGQSFHVSHKGQLQRSVQSEDGAVMSELHILAEHNKVDEARAVLAVGGVQVDERDKTHGVTALMLAVAHDSLGMAKLLLKNGADPNAADANGCSVIMWALGVGSKACVDLIKAAGADESAKDANGLTVADFYGLERAGRRGSITTLPPLRGEATPGKVPAAPEPEPEPEPRPPGADGLRSGPVRLPQLPAKDEKSGVILWTELPRGPDSPLDWALEREVNARGVAASRGAAFKQERAGRTLPRASRGWC